MNDSISKTSENMNSENTKKDSEVFDKSNINYIINEIDKIKQNTYKKNHKETPPQYLLRKLKNLIDKRNKLLRISTNESDDIFEYNEKEIIKYFRKYLIEKARSQQSKGKKSLGPRFGIESNNSILSINTKRNKS